MWRVTLGSVLTALGQSLIVGHLLLGYLTTVVTSLAFHLFLSAVFSSEPGWSHESFAQSCVVGCTTILTGLGLIGVSLLLAGFLDTVGFDISHDVE